jgi:hypothetical protein
VQPLDVVIGVHIEALDKFEEFNFSNSIIKWKNMKHLQQKSVQHG